ncbi:unnamed protein product [Paramecium sonneborni]|uniref:Uncharacterized protein n=1 Tax=Paramecium sonneborni TaxID=65129 RepID=A0A8S1R3Z2_9CILI|nr:unnamed protein product [Paramecium sonneborni]
MNNGLQELENLTFYYRLWVLGIHQFFNRLIRVQKMKLKFFIFYVIMNTEEVDIIEINLQYQCPFLLIPKKKLISKYVDILKACYMYKSVESNSNE